MNEIKVSIVVPVYNVEKYLRRCLDSCVNQTMEEIEVLIINDASPDNCQNIIDEYILRYPSKVKEIVHEENRGLGGARNSGLIYSIGDYILFVDSDDWISINMCEQLYSKACLGNYDIVFGGYQKVFEEGRTLPMEIASCQMQIDLLNEHKIRNSFLFSMHYAWGHLVKRELYLSNHIRYPEKIAFEDIPTVTLLFFYANSAELVEKPLYYYFQRHGSLSKTDSIEACADETKAVDLLMFECDKRGLILEYPKEVEYLYICKGYLWPVCGHLEKFSQPSERYLLSLIRKIKNYNSDYKNNPYYNRMSEMEIVKYGELNEISQELLINVYKNKTKLYCMDFYDKYYGDAFIFIDNRIRSLQENGKKIIVWGAGMKGKEFLRIIDYGNRRGFLVVDSNEAVVGKRLDSGHFISRWKDEDYQDAIVLVTTGKYYYEIKKDMPGVEFYNLDEWVRYGG